MDDLTGAVLPDWARLAISGATIAVYMGKTVAASVAGRLMEAGLPAETTVAVIENASRRDKRLLHGTLKDLPDLDVAVRLFTGLCLADTCEEFLTLPAYERLAN